uniref:DNA-directed RNA polymerase III subunit RPC6 n=1 Tax=Chromera velia CCMP2878 TaxID=1169474 RepID=A0A0G4HXW1_9ALVE|mmetsp:Transcript_52911/g.103474  ORF Transcript_52911/g.103474 Transcript_52911/m.103474 type:complete len:380 (+) Transcript_52911:209-1348(+)|eukprot:Cvel_9357.t1-p1 / transcript=Cvel_9357.t1 / gene=Cvel_9357 / organism=Chromera_velia_CCMP2878 / gene_product=DNA-directed RNA polymerase III subunit RPC6, putative / transcript_product=DNA-directed RNA polymerase III subunit RPC6, putative / location=Cvel_scaffold537:27986-32133(+) / protein_length=379 / sequence_SO=supercontig / SO=protein_coding / is_pseudo=false
MALSSDAQELLQVIKQYQDGSSQDILQKQLDWAPEKLMNVLGDLTKKNLLTVFRNRQNKPLWKYQSPESSQKYQGLNAQDRLVLQTIEKAGNMGVWQRDLKFQTNLSPPILAKSLKNLETKRFIKAVKSVHAKNRKVYMLYNLEPNKEVSGGVWYRDATFDAELIEDFRRHSLQYIKNQPYASLSQIAKYLSSLAVMTDLSESAVEGVLRTLELEGLISKQRSVKTQEYCYAFIKWPSGPLDALTEIPCASCPVWQECSYHEGARVSPSNCEYLSKWLHLSFEVPPHHYGDSGHPLLSGDRQRGAGALQLAGASSGSQLGPAGRGAGGVAAAAASGGPPGPGASSVTLVHRNIPGGDQQPGDQTGANSRHSNDHIASMF